MRSPKARVVTRFSWESPSDVERKERVTPAASNNPDKYDTANDNGEGEEDGGVGSPFYSSDADSAL
jgi:hypothetical protein